jgi:hypothetical protein
MKVTISCAMITAAVLGLAGLAGCDSKGKSTGTNTKETGATGAVIPASYFVTTEPAAAKPIVEVKKGSKAGDEVVMRGRIAGRRDPFTSGRASFMMTDLSLAVCEDGCKTPWDHCCDDKKDIAAVAATVQIVDDKGEVIKGDAKGVHGLEPNAELVVVGKIKSMDEAGNLVVDAKQVYVKKG